MDRDLRLAGRGAPWLLARLRAGELSESGIKLLAHLDYSGAADLFPLEDNWPCRSRGLCLGHFATGIHLLGYGQEAKIIAQSMWVAELIARHSKLGWNASGKNRLWFLSQTEKDILEAIREGGDRFELSSLLCSISDNFAMDSDDKRIKEHVAKRLIALVLNE